MAAILPPPAQAREASKRRYFAAMLLVVDVGNTQTHFGTYRDDVLVEHWRFATVGESTADELGAALRNLLELRGVEGVVQANQQSIERLRQLKLDIDSTLALE